MADLATVVDVRRWLKDQSPDADDDVLPFLEAAQEWVDRVCDHISGRAGAVTDKFYNVLDGTVVVLNDDNPVGPFTVSAVIAESSGLEQTGSEGTIITLSDMRWQLIDHGRIQLIFSDIVGLPSIPGAIARQTPTVFDRVEVTYTASSTIPAPIREAVACLAASEFAGSSADVSGLSSMSLGDISWSQSGDRIPALVRRMIAPYRRKSRARSV